MERKFNEKGQLVVKIPLWQQFPEMYLKISLGNTEYSVSCSYDGEHSLPAKIMHLAVLTGENP